MKTITIKQYKHSRGERGMVEVQVNAHPTPCPTLFAHKENKWEGYRLWNASAGLFVIEYLDTLKQAKEWAARLGAVADFTQSVEQLRQNAALLDLLREDRQRVADKHHRR